MRARAVFNNKRRAPLSKSGGTASRGRRRRRRVEKGESAHKAPAAQKVLQAIHFRA